MAKFVFPALLANTMCPDTGVISFANPFLGSSANQTSVGISLSFTLLQFPFKTISFIYECVKSKKCNCTVCDHTPNSPDIQNMFLTNYTVVYYNRKCFTMMSSSAGESRTDLPCASILVWKAGCREWKKLQ